MNSIYDPDVTQSGHQPLYHDTYGAVYDHYAVISSVARVSVLTVNNAVGVLAGVVVDDDVTSSTTFNTLMEQSHGYSKMLTPLSGSQSEASFVANWSAMKFLGIDPFTSQSYKTQTGANPAEDSTLVCWGIPTDGSTTLTLSWRIDIEYEVLYTELTTPTQS